MGQRNREGEQSDWRGKFSRQKLQNHSSPHPSVRCGFGRGGSLDFSNLLLTPNTVRFVTWIDATTRHLHHYALASPLAKPQNNFKFAIVDQCLNVIKMRVEIEREKGC